MLKCKKIISIAIHFTIHQRQYQFDEMLDYKKLTDGQRQKTEAQDRADEAN